MISCPVSADNSVHVLTGLRPKMSKQKVCGPLGCVQKPANKDTRDEEIRRQGITLKIQIPSLSKFLVVKLVCGKLFNKISGWG